MYTSPFLFLFPFLLWEIQSCSKLSWQSLETQSSIFNSQFPEDWGLSHVLKHSSGVKKGPKWILRVSKCGTRNFYVINFSHYLNLLTYCMWQTFPSCSCDLGPSNLGSCPSSLKLAILSSSPLPLLPLSSYLNLLICKLYDGQRRAQHTCV